MTSANRNVEDHLIRECRVREILRKAKRRSVASLSRSRLSRKELTHFELSPRNAPRVKSRDAPQARRKKSHVRAFHSNSRPRRVHRFPGQKEAGVRQKAASTSFTSRFRCDYSSSPSSSWQTLPAAARSAKARRARQIF